MRRESQTEDVKCLRRAILRLTKEELSVLDLVRVVAAGLRGAEGCDPDVCYNKTCSPVQQQTGICSSL